MDLGISGKVALVIGASRSIGRAVAAELALEGCKVWAAARSADPLRSLAKETGCMAFPCDLMIPTEINALVDHVIVNTGAPDIIYHAIGGSFDGIRDFSLSWSEWEKVSRFNLGICHDINRAFIPSMVGKKWGRIVHTSSDATKCNSGNAPYSSSKFAVEGYVKTASKLYSKDNVIMTAIAPGHLYTEGRWLYSQSEELTRNYFKEHAPIERWGTAQEMAKVVTFLCSEHASYMAGEVVRVDGGSR